MLPRKKRLNTRLFEETFRVGRLYHSHHLSVRVYRHGFNEPSRFSFVVSKKIDSRAVVRNKIKRRLASIITTLTKHKKDAFTENNYIFFAKKSILNLSFQELTHEVTELIQKIHKK